MTRIKTIADDLEQIVVTIVTGNPTADDILHTVKSILDESPAKKVAWDFTDADLSVMTTDDLLQLARFSVSHPNSHLLKNIALILPSDLSYGIGRMFETFGKFENAPWELRLFRKADEAYQWLGDPATEPTER